MLLDTWRFGLSSILQAQALCPRPTLLHLDRLLNVPAPHISPVKVRKATAADLLPLDLALVHRPVTICPRGQHFVLDLQQPELGEAVEPLVSRAGHLIGGGEMDVAVGAIEV